MICHVSHMDVMSLTLRRNRPRQIRVSSRAAFHHWDFVGAERWDFHEIPGDFSPEKRKHSAFLRRTLFKDVVDDVDQHQPTWFSVPNQQLWSTATVWVGFWPMKDPDSGDDQSSVNPPRVSTADVPARWMVYVYFMDNPNLKEWMIEGYLHFWKPLETYI